MFSSAIDSIKDTYSIDTLREIVEHGCISGVAHDHIYYADCIKFYNTYEDEITDYFRDNYDADFLVKLFNEACADLSQYKNDVTWAYIEAISFDVISMDELTNYRVNADGTKTDLSTESLLQPT